MFSRSLTWGDKGLIFTEFSTFQIRFRGAADFRQIYSQGEKKNCHQNSKLAAPLTFSAQTASRIPPTVMPLSFPLQPKGLSYTHLALRQPPPFSQAVPLYMFYLGKSSWLFKIQLRQDLLREDILALPHLPPSLPRLR